MDDFCGVTPPAHDVCWGVVVGEIAGLLLLLAATSATLLAWRVGWRRRVLAVNARRWARRAWRSSDALAVVAVTGLMALGALTEARARTDCAREVPPAIGALLTGMLLMPTFVAMLCAHRMAVCGRAPRELLGIPARTRWRRDVARGVFGGLAMVAPALVLSLLSGQLLALWGIVPRQQDALRWFRDPAAPAAVRVAFGMHGVLIAPVVEEILYRGVLLAVALRTRGRVGAVALVSLLFAAMHLELHLLLPLAFVGAMLALGLLATGSLIVPLVMHMAFNAANLLLVLVAA